MTIFLAMGWVFPPWATWGVVIVAVLPAAFLLWRHERTKARAAIRKVNADKSALQREILSLKAALDERERNRRIANTLAQILALGEELQRQCRRVDMSLPQKEGQQWFDAACDYILKNLGASEHGVFVSTAGTMPMTISGIPEDRLKLWESLNIRLQQLHKIMSKFIPGAP